MAAGRELRSGLLRSNWYDLDVAREDVEGGSKIVRGWTRSIISREPFQTLTSSRAVGTKGVGMEVKV